MNAQHQPRNGTVTWQSPSNIALIKYWGKKGFQLPANPSLSITLSESYTETKVDFKPGNGNIKFYFEGNRNLIFETKILQYFPKISDELPIVKLLDFEIHSKNTFPHSAGIASSASAMSALALCLCSINDQTSKDQNHYNSEFFRQASNLARIGSGSASRSVYGKLVSWGKADCIPGSSDDFASPFHLPVHPVFNNFLDTILIVSKGEKKVSSRAGHGLMDQNPFAGARYNQAYDNLKKILETIEKGDLSGFMAIVENEALTLHGMMMASRPGYMLMEPNTLLIIKKIHDFREQSGANLCFTLDAGPNVHVLYPETENIRVKDFIQNELKPLCENGTMIEDKMGEGPKRVE